jgi:hypothetical protein
MNTISNLLQNLNFKFMDLTKNNSEENKKIRNDKNNDDDYDNHDNDYEGDNNDDDDNDDKPNGKNSSTAYMRHKYNPKTPNPSLYQGYKFNTYQSKIINKTLAKINGSNESKEGFTGLNSKLHNDSQASIMENIRKDYYSTLTEYKSLLNQISNSVTKNVNRIASNNPYLNKYIRFVNGEICFVNSSGVVKKITDSTVLNSISGKNNCAVFNNNTVMNINLPWLEIYNIPGQEIPSNPPLITGTEMLLNESCGYERSNVFVNSMIDKASSKYIGCFQDKKDEPTMSFVGSNPNDDNTKAEFTFKQCQQNAVDQGKQFFSLQNVDSTTGLGFCAVSNDKNTAIKYGKAYKYIPLWSSNTKSQPVSYAVVTKDGTLTVCDQNGKAFFTTPNGTPCEQMYSTSVNLDVPGNDLSFFSNQTVESCKDICNKQSNCNGFVMDSTTNTSCWMKSGEMNNIVSNNQRTTYKKTINTTECNYFLSLQDDGNMCVYKGIPNTQNVTTIWCSNTNGQQRERNGNFSPEKSKYGMTFLKTDQILNKGDWISSSTGNLLLMMTNDGDLVLYTFQSNCSKNKDNNFYGGVLANSLYDIGQVGVKSNMGQVAFIDPNSQLHNYPTSNIQFAKTYSRILENTTISGNDIVGETFGNATNVEECMTACNNNENCSGFVYDSRGETATCIPKDNKNLDLYTNNEVSSHETGVNTYVRDKTFIELPPGIYNKTNNIDSLDYENYVKYNNNNGGMNTNYGLTNVTSVQKNQLHQLEDKLKQLSSQLNGYTNNLSDNSNSINEETKQNSNKFNQSVSVFSDVKNKIKHFDTNNNIDNILNQVQVNTLQKNYSYIFWTILAIILILLTIYIRSFSSSQI